MAEHEIVFERSQMVEKLEFLDEDFEETLTGCLISCIDGALKSRDITVLQGYFGVNERNVFCRHNLRLTSACITHFLSRRDPIAIMTAVPNEVQTFPSREDLSHPESNSAGQTLHKILSNQTYLPPKCFPDKHGQHILLELILRLPKSQPAFSITRNILVVNSNSSKPTVG
jgi:hypothetical protein